MMRRFAAALAVVSLVGSPTMAAPKKAAARTEFDRGVAAYTKGDYAGASDALGKSYTLEADAETLFAWAQTERKLDRCDKAIELYGKLLAMKLPDENKAAVRVQIDECKAIIAAAKPEPDPKPDPPADPDPDGKPDPNPDALRTVTHAQADPTGEQTQSPGRSEDQPRAWWKNPVGGALVGLGIVGVGIGTVFFVQGSSADSDKDNAATYDEYLALSDKADSRGQLGVISLVAGGALITAGVIWYATHKSKPAEKTVSGWVAPSGGGLALSGSF